MRRVMVYYTVKPEAAEANERVVRDVYEEFGRLRPDEFRYGTFVLDDGALEQVGSFRFAGAAS